MPDETHRVERTHEQETRQQMESAHSPEHFYPRPQDVLDDATLSRDEKRELLRNWQTQLQDRGGSLGVPRMDHTPEDEEATRAVAEAIRDLGDQCDHPPG